MTNSSWSKGPKWILKGGRVVHLAPFCIMGIVNLTPDSFYDGGRYTDPEMAISHCFRLVDQGADILDLGGESTRPYAQPVETAEELERLLPVLRQVLDSRAQVPISVDTYKAATAKQVLEAGAAIINDISACRFDPGLADVLVNYRPGYVLMHSQGRPRDMQEDPKYNRVVDEVLAFFEDRLEYLVRLGLPERCIALDPGIGFGKRLEHNLELLRCIDRFLAFGRPLMVGLSNKSVWGKLFGQEGKEREWSTQVATALLATRGVAIHRVHDVQLTRQSLELAERLVPKG